MTVQSFRKYESRMVKSADGTEIYADALGNRSPGVPTIVMIPGFSMVKAAFDSIFEDHKWTSNAFLVRYDSRGQGGSGKPLNDEAWESERFSEDFEAVCKEFGVTKAFVMGWSLGAINFVDIVNHCKSVTINGLINASGLIYLDPAVLTHVVNPESLAILGALSQSTDVDAFQKAVLQFVSWLSDYLNPELYRKLLEGVIVVPRDVAVKLTTRIQDPRRMLQLGREGRLDVLVVMGEKDKFFCLDGVKSVYEEVGWKNVDFRLVEGADHMTWLSRPDVFRDTVLTWIQGRH